MAGMFQPGAGGQMTTLRGMVGMLDKKRRRRPTGGTGVSTVTRRRRRPRDSSARGRLGGGTDISIRDMAPAAGGPSPLSRSRRQTYR